MKRSEALVKFADEIKKAMIEKYHTVIDCNGEIQYRLYVWENGEIASLEGVHGDTAYLVRGDADEELFYVATIAEPCFNPWDAAGVPAPDDETERETERQEIIDWCSYEYENNIDDLYARIINDAESEEA